MKTLNKNEVRAPQTHAIAPTRSHGTASGEALEIVQVMIDACLEAKGRELVVLDVHDVFDISDYFIVVSGRSDRQTQGISNRVLEALEKNGIRPEFVEGYDQGQWVIIDCIDVVLHVFYEPVREQYDLEGLWVKAKKLVVGSGEGNNKKSLQAA